MKRWVSIITICILIGAIINVAVAWWFAIPKHGGSNSTTSYLWGISSLGSGYRVWRVDTSIRVGVTFSISEIYAFTPHGERELSLEEALPYWADLLRPDPDTNDRYPLGLNVALANGWPFRSAMIIAGPDFNPDDIFLRGLPWDAPDWIRGKLKIPASQTSPVYLPLKIIWPGFVTNTILYANVPFLLLIMKFRLRGYLRSRRKQCTKCGYPIGQSEVCTECGAELKASTIIKRFPG